MILPKQAQPVLRQVSNLPKSDGIKVASCAGVPNNILGTCFDANGPIGNRFNCTACCALRGAISWQGGVFAVAC